LPDRSTPWIVPLGDAGLLVRFGTTLSGPANARAIAFARALTARGVPAGVTEIVPSLVSVLLRYDPGRIGFAALAGDMRLLAGAMDRPGDAEEQGRLHRIGVAFDGADLAEVAERLGLSVAAFVDQHTASPLKVLATGFAPGFVYCGFHPDALRLERRPAVRPLVPAGTVLFAAGQTAIAATPIPTGWHVIGHTPFRNFDPSREPPTELTAGDRIRFEVLA
jgi:KipI family sensor histidine kinase inhibitor